MNEDYNIPSTQAAFNFTRISDIVDRLPNTMIDVIGIVSKCEDAVSSLVRGEAVERRVLEFVDDSAMRVSITFCGTSTVLKIKKTKIGDIIAVKYTRVGNFSGRSLSA